MTKAPEKFETAFEEYSVIKVHGEGGAGRVFIVKDSDGDQFALKCLFPKHITTEKRKRFKNEIDFCSKMRHFNLIQVADSGLVVWEGAKTPFYVMPFFPMTLRNLMEKGVALNQILPLFSQILDGVEAAHLLGVIHRDLKPENILYDPNKNLLVIADFGIAHFEEDLILTAVDTLLTSKLANFGYSAPEQRAKGSKVDHRADIYALGLILNEMFTGIVPHGMGYKKVAPEYAYLDPLIEGMLQQSPDARPQSIREVKIDLIGHKNKFVALQQLDSKKREVLPSSTPDHFVPISILDVDWGNGLLSFKLDQNPSQEWIRFFQNPRGGTWNSLYGSEPIAFRFQRNSASVPIINEEDTQRIVTNFKDYLQRANSVYQAYLKEQAAERELERRRNFEREVAEAEKKARILGKIKI